MNQLIGIIADIMIAICLLVMLKNMQADEWGKISWGKGAPVIVALLGIMIAHIFIQEAGKDSLKNIITEEVELENVGVKGKNNFLAQIKIEYVDGELENIALIPHTTIQIPVSVEK